MSAIAAVYISRCGFAIGADGRARWSDPEQVDEIKKRMESDEEQKVFEATAKNAMIAYAITGTAYNDDKSFSIIEECQKAATNLSRIECANPLEYVELFCRTISDSIAAAHAAGRFDYSPRTLCPPGEEHLIVRVMYCGYFNGEPFACDTAIFNEQEVLTTCATQYDLRSMAPLVLGSEKIAKIMYIEKDWRFRNYRIKITDSSSIQDAIACVKGYLRACSTPLAKRLDPFCEIVGGHIHVAMLIPQSGFQWAIPPKSSS